MKEFWRNLQQAPPPFCRTSRAPTRAAWPGTWSRRSCACGAGAGAARAPWPARRGWWPASATRRAIAAPAGFVYSGHSCRAGSLSEASALGVPIVRLRFVGGYAVGSRVPEDKYIDPTCPPSPAGAFFFGWLQPPRSTCVDVSFGNYDSDCNPSEPSASRQEKPVRHCVLCAVL